MEDLVKDALGLIILIDNSRTEPLADLAVYLASFADKLRSLPCVIGVGRMDVWPAPDLDAYADALAASGLTFPFFQSM